MPKVLEFMYVICFYYEVHVLDNIIYIDSTQFCRAVTVMSVQLWREISANEELLS